MSKVTLPDGRIIETNDEILRMVDDPHDDAKHDAKLLPDQDAKQPPHAKLLPDHLVDNESEEWKELSERFDAIQEDIDLERDAKKPKRKKKSSNGASNPGGTGWVGGQDGFTYTTDGGIAKTDPNNIKHAVKLLNVKLCHNEFSGQTQVWGLYGRFGAEFQDADACRLRFLIYETHKFLPPRQLFEDVLVDIAHQASFHPVRDYLDARVWDGKPRIDNWLTAYGGAEDTPFNRAAGRIFLIAGVRRIRHPGCKFDTMVVFESPAQGRNKSQAARILATREEWFNDNLPIGAKPQEVIEQIGGHWIIEFPELAGISSREVEHVRAFLSRQVDRARPAYGRRREVIRRQFVAIGTINDEEYLKNDERRFWPVRIEKFDLDSLFRDAEQLWAEASHYEGDGEPITLQEDLWEDASVVRGARTFENPYRSALQQRFRRSPWMTSGEVWEFLGIPRDQRLRNAKEVGRALQSLGFTRKQARKDLQGMQRGDYFYENTNSVPAGSKSSST